MSIIVNDTVLLVLCCSIHMDSSGA